MENGVNPVAVPRPAVSSGWLGILGVLVLALGASLFMEFGPTSGVPVGTLPREGDVLVPGPYPVGEWIAGAKGTIGLKYLVSGSGLGENQYLRFSEGAGRATASVMVLWQDENGLPVGEPFEKPFKDDC
jgi:hypothetical protein